MTAVLDTSVLVAALVDQLPGHERCFSMLSGLLQDGNSAACATHAVAELFAVLSALPIQPRISPGEAELLITESVVQRCQVVSLGAEDYAWALRQTVTAGLAGGAVYDALHIAAARRIGATRLYTYNLRHFRVLSPPGLEVTVP